MVMVVTDKNTLENHIEHHFKNIFNPNSVLQDNGMIQNNIPKLVEEQTNNMLNKIPYE